MNREQLIELLYQSLETERGGIKIYETAVQCAQNDDLKKEWGKYLDETRNHEVVMLRVLDGFGLDAQTETPGRRIVRSKGEALVQSMKTALQGDPAAAQLVAAECVVEAETKDHMNWELIGEVAKKLTGEEAKILKEAHGEVEEQEDEHLYHTMGWARELWLESLGLPAVLPPPEEQKHTKSAIGADRAKQARTEML
jgi:rubrerythrin